MIPMRKLLLISLLAFIYTATALLAGDVNDFRRGAAQGNAGAMSSLGWCYEHGDGVQKDVQEAVKWYRAAAAKRHAGGQCNLGSCYERGVGVGKDAAEAVRWYKVAAAQEHTPAKAKLDELGISTLD